MTINREHLAGLELALSLMIKQRLSSGGVHLNALASLEAAVEQAQAAPEAEPVAKVSQETFSSDGTSDIITCNLPIGTKLYTASQHDAELVELLRELRGSADCENVHHRPHEYHDASEPCKVLARIDAKLATLRHV